MTPTDITLDAAPRRRDGVTSVELDGESILYVGDSGEMLKLDPVGSVLWDCFDGRTTLGQIVADLTAVYDADGEVVSRDVVSFTRELAALGALEGPSRRR